MKTRINIAIVFFVITFSVVAMPSASELSGAKGAIDTLVAGEQKAIKGGKSAAESAKSFKKIAGESTSEAEKYWLYRHAFAFYVQADDQDAAVDVLDTMKKEISDFSADETEKIITAHAKKQSFQTSSPIGQVVKELKNLQKAKKTIENAHAALKKKPDNLAAYKAAGEAYAVLGDWEKALAEFSKAGGKCAAVAKSEAEGEVTIEIADFWKDMKPSTKLVGADVAYRAHAEKLYEEMSKDEALSAVQKMLVKQKLEELTASESEAPVEAAPISSGKVNYKLPGLVAHWAFDGDLQDEAKKYKFTEIGKVGYEKDRRGKPDKCLTFIDGKVGLSFPEGFCVEDNMTIAVWVKPGAKIGNFPPQDNRANTKDYQGNKGPLLISPCNCGRSDSAGIGFEVGEDGVVLMEHSSSYVPATLVYQGNIKGWTHVVITREKGATPILYINGKKVATGLVSNRIGRIHKCCLGEELYAMKRFSGCVDDLAIYNRALSDSEIKKISKK